MPHRLSQTWWIFSWHGWHVGIGGWPKKQRPRLFQELQYPTIYFNNLSWDFMWYRISEYLYMGMKPIKPTIYKNWCGYTRRTTNNKSLLYLWQHHATKCASLPQTFARFFSINRWTAPGVAGLSITARNCHKNGPLVNWIMIRIVHGHTIQKLRSFMAHHQSKWRKLVELAEMDQRPGGSTMTM